MDAGLVKPKMPIAFVSEPSYFSQNTAVTLILSQSIGDLKITGLLMMRQD